MVVKMTEVRAGKRFISEERLTLVASRRGLQAAPSGSLEVNQRQRGPAPRGGRREEGRVNCERSGPRAERLLPRAGSAWRGRAAARAEPPGGGAETAELRGG